MLDRAVAILAPAEDALGGINGQRLEVLHVPVVSLVVYSGLSHIQGSMEEPVQGLPCAGGDHHGLHGLRNGLFGFLIIDLVVASILMSMGMMMLPPVTISLPFKLIFFVLVDGWRLLTGSLVESFIAGPPI